MKRFLNKKTIWLTAAAAVLAGGISLPGAMAYFTANTNAEGSAAIALSSPTTEVVEDPVVDMTKNIKVKNTGEVSCFVRVRLYAGEQIKLSISGKNWTHGTEGDDVNWYYYSTPLAPGKIIVDEDILKAKITFVNQEFDEDFNVAVVQECTPVLYDDDGNPYADWDLQAVERGSEE